MSASAYPIAAESPLPFFLFDLLTTNRLSDHFIFILVFPPNPIIS